MKITKADIKQAIANTPANLNNEDIRVMQSVFLGFYTQEMRTGLMSFMLYLLRTDLFWLLLVSVTS